MEFKTKRVMYQDFSKYDLDGANLDTLIEELIECKRDIIERHQGIPGSIELAVNTYDSSFEYEVVMSFSRLETEVERDERIHRENKQNQENEAREKKLLETLKAKYESK